MSYTEWKARQVRAILAAIAAKKTSFVALASATGLSRQMLRLFLFKENNISMEALLKVLAALDIEIEPTMREQEPMLDPFASSDAGRIAQSLLAQYLSNEADEKGLNISDIARAAGLPVTTVAAILENRGEFYFSELIKVAQVLDLHLGFRPRDIAINLGDSQN